MADSDFGLKIGIEGEREFKAGLRDINQQFKVLGSEMKLVESQFNKQDRSVSALTSRNEVLTRQITEQKDKIELLRKALENSAESFGENDQRTKQWTVQLNNAQAQLNNMERELQDNEKAIDGVGDEFQSAKKKADGFGDEVKEAANKSDDANVRFRKLGDTLKTIGRALAIGVVAIGTAATDLAVEFGIRVGGGTYWHMVPEVIEIQSFLGRVDVRLSIIARDMGHYQEIYRDRILTLPHIADIEALMLVSTIKDSASLPL